MLSSPIIATPILAMIISFIEIAVIALIIDYFLASIWNTKTTEALVFVMGFFVLFILSQILGMFALAGVSSILISLSATVLPILFQQELKLALISFGSGNRFTTQDTYLEKFLDSLATCAYKMGSKRIGCLIVIERVDSLQPFIQGATVIDAIFSAELVETIFYQGTPLHDGAIIIQGSKILAASVILPLSEESKLSGVRTIGTRHRAAIGITQQTDAFVIVISEESGKMSIVNNGIPIFGIKIDKLKAALKEALIYENN